MRNFLTGLRKRWSTRTEAGRRTALFGRSGTRVTRITDADWHKVIDLAYRSFLGRSPVESEYGLWSRHRSRSEPVRVLLDDVKASVEAQRYRQAVLQPDKPVAIAGVAATNDAVGGISAADWRSVVELGYRHFLGRIPNEDEQVSWSRFPSESQAPIRAIVDIIGGSEEARQRRERESILPQVSDGAFVQSVYRIVYGRGPIATEVEHWDIRLRRGLITRETLLAQMFNEEVRSETVVEPANDPGYMTILGTSRVASKAEWEELETGRPAKAKSGPRPAVNRFAYARKPGPRVGIVTSLYCGGRYIEQFLANMIEQTIFDQCELIIIDAASPEGEYERVRDVVAARPNILYERLDERIGIYPAWNMAVERSRAPYLTNANLDDLRRKDSFEMQAATLDALPFVDVVYQDFLIAFDDKVPFADIARRDLRSRLPAVTPNNLLSFNSPHNAPMWRRSLHDEVGLFDPTYKSAGDYEFWARCLAAGKTFYKINDPHVSYYVNPAGLSTKAETQGIAEAHRMYTEQGPRLISPRMTESIEDFRRACGLPPRAEDEAEIRPRYDIANAALLGLQSRLDATMPDGAR